MKIKVIITLLIFLACSNLKAQTYYWIGGSGNWSDTSNWSATSGDSDDITGFIPGINNAVVFDSNSFDTPNQVVTIDTNVTVKSIAFRNAIGAFTPRLVGGDSISINLSESFTLHSSIDYGFYGKINFNSLGNDSIVTAGKQLLNDVSFRIADSLFLYDDFYTTGSIYYNSGTLNANGKVITAKSFRASNSSSRNFYCQNASLNLTGADTILYSKRFSNLYSDGLRVNSSYVGDSTILISFKDTTQSWGRLELNNHSVKFLSSAYFDTIITPSPFNLKSVSLANNSILKFRNFDVNGNCGKIVDLIGLSGNQEIFNLEPLSMDGFRIKNIKFSSTHNVIAHNSIDLGGNQNITINSDATTETYYWVGGSGNFYNPAHWAISSGGAPDLCFPLENDICIFDANSGLTVSDTVSLDKDVYLRSIDFSGISNSFVLAGDSSTRIILKQDLKGSSFLNFDWDGEIVLTTDSPGIIKSNGYTWENLITKKGSESITFNDDFSSNNKFLHEKGGVIANSKILSFNEFESESTSPSSLREISIQNSEIKLLGSKYSVDKVGLNAINFSNNNFIILSETPSSIEPAVNSVNLLHVKTDNQFRVISDSISYNDIILEPGSSISLDNFSKHIYENITAQGTCDSLVTIKSVESILSPANLFHQNVWNGSMNFDYCIIDNVNAGDSGLYIISNSIVSDSSKYWSSFSSMASSEIRFSFTPSDTIQSGSSTASIAGSADIDIPQDAVILSADLVVFGIDTILPGNFELDSFYVKIGGDFDNQILSQDSIVGDSSIYPFNKTIQLSLSPSDSGSVSITLNSFQTTGPGSVSVDSAMIKLAWGIPYSKQGGKYFWVNDGGDWNDLSHWSETSGGVTPVTCLPSIGDTVVFDNNSFSSDGEAVNLLSTAYVSMMTWEDNDDSTLFNLNSDLVASGDVILNDKLKIDDNDQATFFVFQPNDTLSNFDPNGVKQLPSIKFNGKGVDDTLNIVNSMLLGNNTFTIYGGVAKTNSNTIQAESINISVPIFKSVLDLGASDIILSSGFSDISSLSGISGASEIHKGTSNIIIDYQGEFSSNFFRGKDLDLNRLEFRFTPVNESYVNADNLSVDTLIVAAGSILEMVNSSRINVSKLLKMDGNCKDSIFVKTQNNSHSYTINHTTDSIEVSCVSFSNASLLGNSANSVAFFSHQTNSGVNQWNFSTDSSTTVSFGSFTNQCLGDTLNFSNVSSAFRNDTSNLVFTWNFGDGTADTTGNLSSHYYQSPGEYTILLTSVYSNQCKDTMTKKVNIYSPSVNLRSGLNNNAVCEGVDVLFNTSVSGNDFYYEYFINGNSQGPSALNADTLLALNLVDGDSVVVEVNQEGCLNQSSPVVMNVIDKPTIEISYINDTICEGVEVQFVPSGGDEYRYFLNGNVQTTFISGSFAINNLQNGDQVFAIGRDSTQCVDTTEVVDFTVNPLPVISSFTDDDSDNVLCTMDTVTFTGVSDGSRHLFFINDVLQQDSTIFNFKKDSLNNLDSVYFISKSSEGCLSAPSQIMTYFVNQNPLTTLSIPNDSICTGNEVTFTASGAFFYRFFVNGVPQNTLNTIPTFSTSSLVSGSQVYVEGFRNQCIGKSQVITPTVVLSPSLTITSNLGDSICASDEITLTAASSSATSYEFALNGNTQSSGPINTHDFSSINNGDQLSVTARFDICSTTESMPITVFNNPSASLFSSESDNKVCENESITFTGTGGTLYKYNLNGNLLHSSIGNYASDSLPVSPVGGYDTLTVLVIDTITGCSTLSSDMLIEVTELPELNLVASEDSICNGSLVRFTATGGASSYQYFINTQSQSLPTADSVFTSSILSDGDFVTVIGYNDGCSSPSLDTIHMTVNQTPNPTLVGPSTLCEGENGLFTAGTGTDYLFILDQNAGAVSANNVFSTQNIASGSHTLKVIVSENGCSDSTNRNFTIAPNPIVSVAGSDTLCSNEPVTYIASGASNYEYFLNGTSVSNILSYTTSTLTDNDTLRIVGSSNLGCVSDTVQKIVTVRQSPIIQLNSSDADTILCLSDTVVLTASGATDYQYSINNVNVGPFSAIGLYQSDSIQHGDVVRVIGRQNGCLSSPREMVFQVFNRPVVGLQNIEDTVLCGLENTNLIASGADSYLYYVDGVPQGSFNSSPAFNSNVPNGAVVKVEGMVNTCSSVANSTYTFSVWNNPTPTISSSDADLEICEGEQVVLTASGAQSYEFYKNNLLLSTTSPNTVAINSLSHGDSIWVVGFNSLCPGGSNDTLVFSVNSMDLNIETNPDSYMLCNGEALTVNLSGADEYELFLNGSSYAPQSNVSTFNLTNLNDGDYISFNGHSNSTGCTQSFTYDLSINEFEELNVTVSPSNTICEGDSIKLNSHFARSTWYKDGVLIQGANDSIYYALESGDYSVDILHGGEGEVWSIGQNAYGEFGDTTNQMSSVPSQSFDLTSIVKVASGDYHTMFLKEDGKIYLSGSNTFGQLGDGTYTSNNRPVLIQGIPQVTDIAASAYSSVAVTNSGQLFVWGGNVSGELGMNSFTVYPTPQWNSNINDVAHVAGGEKHFVVLKSDGTVWSSGSNSSGQLGDGSLDSSNVFTQVTGLTNIKNVWAGDYHSIAVDSLGQMFVWGDNTQGQLGLGDLNSRITPVLSPLKNVKCADGGNSHTLVLTDDSKVFVTGNNELGQLGVQGLSATNSPVYSGINGVDSVSSGSFHSLLLKVDGSVLGAGFNEYDQLEENADTVFVPTKLESVDGVTFINAGINASHFIFGNKKVCSSNNVSLTVNNSPQPVLTLVDGKLQVSPSADAYTWYFEGNVIQNSNSSSIVPIESGNYWVTVNYSNGCSRISEPFTFGSSSIDDISSDLFVKVFPNPAKDKVSVLWSSNIDVKTVSMKDVSGKILYKNDSFVTNTTEFLCSNLPQGMYFVSIESEKSGSFNVKLIVE